MSLSDVADIADVADVSAERAVLAGICQYGDAAYYDIIDYVKESTFTEEINQVIFKCLKNLFENNDNIQIDVPTMFSSAQEIGLEKYFATTADSQHLQAILTLPVELANTRKHAAKIRKLEITNLLHKQLGLAQGKLQEVKGTESITSILNIAEDAVFNFGALLDEEGDEPTKLGDGIMDHVKFLEENPIDQVGISTGFPLYDVSIGGGLRPGTVNVVVARSKIGKSMISLNMGLHIAQKLEIPVLYMDTEMVKEDQVSRILANLANVSINKLETGKFSKEPELRQRVYDASKILKEIPFFHRNISGLSFEEQVSLMRRWITMEVGMQDNGKANQCMIIYDYLKLMSASDIDNGLQEYQSLGFLISSIHNFAVRYGLPVFALVQSNRAGINQETSDIISGSDRLLWLASNLTIYKDLSDEEIAEQGTKAGNTKLVPVAARHGAGLQSGDYINCKRQGHIATITEGQTRYEIEQGKQGQQGLNSQNGQNNSRKTDF